MMILIIKREENEMSKYINSDICSKCGGLCCKSGGCIISPDQFKEFNKENLKTLIFTGMVVIDWWEGNPLDNFENPPTKDEQEIIDTLKNIDSRIIDEEYYVGDCVRAYFIRMRVDVDNRDYFMSPSWGGHCMMHKIYGICPIDINHRGYEAAYMIPNKDRIDPDVNVRFNAICHGDEFSDKYSKCHIAAMYLQYNDIIEDCIDEIRTELENKKCLYNFVNIFDKEKSINVYNDIIKYTKFD